MKTISFKVDDSVYYNLKNKFKNQTFKSIFEQVAIDKAHNDTVEMSIPHCIRKNNDDLYKDIKRVLKQYEKTIKNDER